MSPRRRMLGERQDRALERRRRAAPSRPRSRRPSCALASGGISRNDDGGETSPLSMAKRPMRSVAARRRSAASPWRDRPRRAPRLRSRGRAPCASGLPSRVLERADACVVEAGEAVVFVSDVRGHPGAGVRDGEQLLAVWIEDEARPAAEARRRRGQHDTAAPFELAELGCRTKRSSRTTPIFVARTSTSSMARLDVFGLLSRQCRARDERHDDGDRHDLLPRKWHEGTPICVEIRRSKIQRAACAACRREGRPRFPAEASSLACSSNNSTSLSVMAPASSLGSVMVTARE